MTFQRTINESFMKRALFPLPVFLLPGGRTRLRVFEPRYKRLVKESAGETGFIILPYDNLPNLDDPICQWGSHVQIVDFENGEDGLLHIDVECIGMVNVSSFDIEEDGLKRGECEPSEEHWPVETIDTEFAQSDDAKRLIGSLQSVFEYNPELAELYQTTNFDSAKWVCQRWLELLPLKRSEQNVFAQPHSFKRAFQFLSSIVFE